MSRNLELNELETKFRRIEKDSLIEKVPDDQFLCVRLDGFKATKRYLKENKSNPAFSEALKTSTIRLMAPFKGFLTKDKSMPFIAAFCGADEVSVILNARENKYEGRIQKLTSLFAGMLSAQMTGVMTLKHEEDYRNEQYHSVVFDSRPLLLQTPLEIAEYLRYRYLIVRRYTMWKILRLEGFPVNSDEAKKDFELIERMIDENDFHEDYHKILFRLQFPAHCQRQSDCLYRQ